MADRGRSDRHAVSTECTSFVLTTVHCPGLADITIKKMSGEDVTPQERIRKYMRVTSKNDSEQVGEEA